MHTLSAQLRPQAPPPLALWLELGAGDGSAYRVHPPCRNREAPALVSLNGARVLPICSLRTRREKWPWPLPGAGLCASDRDPRFGPRLHLSRPPRARPSDCSLHSLDLGLDRVRFPFSRFLRANRTPGSPFSAPQFSISLARPPSCGQPAPPLARSPRRVRLGAPCTLRPPSPLVARPRCHVAPRAASLRNSEGDRGARTSPPIRAWGPAPTLEVATLPSPRAPRFSSSSPVPP